MSERLPALVASGATEGGQRGRWCLDGDQGCPFPLDQQRHL